MVVNTKPGTGQALQNDAEPSRRDIEAAGLNPDSISIGNPRPVIIDVCVGYEVVAVPLGRIETVGDAVKSGYRHNFTPRRDALGAHLPLGEAWQQTNVYFEWKAAITDHCRGSAQQVP